MRIALGRELDLPVPAVTSHTARDRFARLGMELAILAGSLTVRVQERVNRKIGSFWKR